MHILQSLSLCSISTYSTYVCAANWPSPMPVQLLKTACLSLMCTQYTIAWEGTSCTTYVYAVSSSLYSRCTVHYCGLCSEYNCTLCGYCKRGIPYSINVICTCVCNSVCTTRYVQESIHGLHKVIL